MFLRKIFIILFMRNQLPNKYLKLLRFAIAISLCFLFVSINAQDDSFYGPNETETKEQQKQKRQDKLQRWSFGGNFWLSAGSETYIELSPVAMYRASPRFLIGPGFTYIFRKSNYYNYQTSYYGPRAIASYSLFKDFGEVININIGDIILHSEYELLSVEKLYLDPNNTVIKDGRALINSLLVGGGIFQPIGQRGGLSIMLLYNLIESDFSPYTNPVIRFGFYF